MAQISLRFNIVDSCNTKTLQVYYDSSIHEVLQDLKERLGERDGSDHGLFWPDHGKWLQPTRTIAFYDLKSGDVVDYKKRHRVLRVRMMDDSVKTVLIDESVPVTELVVLVCEKIGIANADEYSLFFDGTQAPDPGAASSTMRKSVSGTLLKNASGSKNSLAQDDGGRWLSPEKSLPEQKITDSDVVTLKKKFFYSDQNVDRNDPVQLNLLYVQAKDDILSGKYPCTEAEACNFAAIQLQVQFGNHEPDKHKSGTIKLKDFLPPEYQKAKGTEKTIFHEHRKLQGLSELNAKFRYVQLCRSLKTYGVTFFIVKEKVPKKSKLEPVLLGVSKESVLRLDVETKAILQQWALTQIRRWSATPNSFTLDFGDYENSYYAVQTSEGEQISALISGYIDIILKRKKESDRIVPVEDEEQVTVEQIARFGRAHQLDRVTIGERKVMGGQQFVAQDMHAEMYQTFRPGAEISAEGRVAQKGALRSITHGVAGIKNAAMDLNTPAQLPPLGSDAAAVAWKNETMHHCVESLGAKLSSQLASVAKIINSTNMPTPEFAFEEIASAISNAMSNVVQSTSEIKMISALSTSDKDKEAILVDGRMFALESAKILESIQPILAGQQDNYKDFYSTADTLKRIVGGLLDKLGKLEVTPAEQKKIEAVSVEIANFIARELVPSAKGVAGEFRSVQQQQSLAEEANAFKGNGEKLVAATRAISAAVNSKVCSDELMAATVLLRDQINLFAEKSSSCPSDATFRAFKDKVRKIDDLVAQLIKTATNTGDAADEGEESNFEKLTSGLARVQLAVLQPKELNMCLKDIGILGSTYINALKNQAAASDGSKRNALLGTAKTIADALAQVITAAKDTAKSPSDEVKLEQLRQLISNAQHVVGVAGGVEMKDKVFRKLVRTCKRTCETAIQSAVLSKTIASSNGNQDSQMQLNKDTKRVGELTDQLANTTRDFVQHPDVMSQIKVVECANDIVAPLASMIASGRAAVPSVADVTVQSQFANILDVLEDELGDLQANIRQAESCLQATDLETALKFVDSLRSSVAAAKANVPRLEPIPNMDLRTCQNTIGDEARKIKVTFGNLKANAAEGDSEGTAMQTRLSLKSLQNLVNATKGFYALQRDVDANDPATKFATYAQSFNELDDLLVKSKAFLESSTDHESGNQQAEKVLFTTHDESLRALTKFASSLPGLKDLDTIIKIVADTRKVLANIPQYGSVKGNIKDSISGLNKAAAAVVAAMKGLVVASKGTTDEIKHAAEEYEKSFAVLVDTARTVMALTDDPNTRGLLTDNSKDLLQKSVITLVSVKNAYLNSSDPILRKKLFTATQEMSESINKLVNSCSVPTKGHTECNKAIEVLHGCISRVEGVNDAQAKERASYAACVLELNDQRDKITTMLGKVDRLNAGSSPSDIGKVAFDLAALVARIVDAAANATYALGVSDPESHPATQGLVEFQAVEAAVKGFKSNAAEIVDPRLRQADIMKTAGVLAKHTSYLVSTSRALSENGKVVAQDRAHFSAIARDLTSSAGALAQMIKALSIAQTDENRAALQHTTGAMSASAGGLLETVSRAEYMGERAQIGAAGQTAQEPLLYKSYHTIDCAERLTNALKDLCSDPQDAKFGKAIKTVSRSLAETVANLVGSVSENIPGYKEFDTTTTKVKYLLPQLDQAIADAAAGRLVLSSQDPIFAQEAVSSSLRVLTSLAELTRNSALEGTMAFKSAIPEIPASLATAIKGSIDLASINSDKSVQNGMLSKAKVLSDALIQFLESCKKRIADPSSAASTSSEITQKGERLKDAAKQLLNFAQGSGESNEFTAVISDIEAAVGSLTLKGGNVKERSFAASSMSLERSGKDLLTEVGSVLSNAKTSDDFVRAAQTISKIYQNLVASARAAVKFAPEDKVRRDLEISTRSCGGALIKLVETIRLVQNKEGDIAARMKLTSTARDVSSTVGQILSAAKEGSRGVAKAQEAIIKIGDYIADLESHIIFAQAGQLDPIDSKDNFTRHRDGLLDTTKNFTEMTKAFVSAVTTSQEEFAATVSSATGMMGSLKDLVKNAAISITSGDKVMQEKILATARLIAEDFTNLVTVAIGLAGAQQLSDEEDAQLTDAVKSQIQHLADLVRLTRLLGDEASRGVRTIESTLVTVDEYVASLMSNEPAQGSALPDEVAGLAKQLITSTASLVSASSGKQEDLIAAINAIKLQLKDLVRASKAATEQAPEESRRNMQMAVKGAASALKELLLGIKSVQETGSSDAKNKMQSAAKNVASSMQKVFEASSALIPGGYVDPNDPNVIAERELLAAAASIEAAAKKLAQLKPPEKIEVNDDLNFEEQILEAAKAIAAASAALIRSATGAQREIVAAGRSRAKSGEVYFSDGTWSDGLVSAAKKVAFATGDLCEAANQALKGNVQRERVIASAKSVSASTAALLSAAGVKGDPNSQAQIRLRAAGKAVTSATEQLVKAAEESLVFDDSEAITSSLMKEGPAMKQVQELEAQMDIIRMERELEKARTKLAAVRKGKYQK